MPAHRATATHRHVGRKVAAVATVSLIVLLGGAGTATASDPTPGPLDPVVTPLTNALQNGAQQLQQQAPSASPAQAAQPNAAAASSSPDPSTSHGVTEPAAPDHASAQTIGGGSAGGSTGSTPLSASGPSSTSTINDDGSSSSDATLLAAGGMQLFGTSASSSGPTKGTGPADALCTNSQGAVCPFQADTTATKSATSSDSSSTASVAAVCLSPAQLPFQIPGLPTGGSLSCLGGVSTGILTAHSQMHRDLATGQTTGSSSSSVASVCLPGAPGGGCISAINSQSSANSDGTNSHSSSIADVFGMTGPGSDPNGTPDALCDPTGTGLDNGLCGFVNQGGTYLDNGAVAVAQNALSGSLLGQGSLTAGHTEARVHTVAPPSTAVSPPSVSAPVISSPAVTQPAVHKSVAQEVAGVLPHTGGIWSGWLAIGLLTLALGCALAARDLRKQRALA